MEITLSIKKEKLILSVEKFKKYYIIKDGKNKYYVYRLENCVLFKDDIELFKRTIID